MSFAIMQRVEVIWLFELYLKDYESDAYHDDKSWVWFYYIELPLRVVTVTIGSHLNLNSDIVYIMPSKRNRNTSYLAHSIAHHSAVGYYKNRLA
jgi:hypothetical protein